MVQILPDYVVCEEFSQMAKQIVAKYPERFSELDLDQLIAYLIVNKDRPERSRKPYTIKGESPPQSFTNSKTYFVEIFQNVWDRTQEQKLALVFSALNRIDLEAGKIKPLDYQDQEEMVSTFGANWHERGDLPDILKQDVEIR
jgi:hypothetical protein